MFKLTNKSGGQIVCDLATKGKTLRFNNKQTKDVPDKELTPHIHNLVKQGLILCEKVEEPVKEEKETTTSKSGRKKVKED